MRTYFAFSNLWLMLAMVLFLGRSPENALSSDEPRCSLFGVGQHLSNDAYNLLIGVCFLASALCIILVVRSVRTAE